MPSANKSKKMIPAKKTPVKINKWEESMRKLITQRSKELAERKLKNATQKWFFSQDERSQKLLENTYRVVLQLCPNLTREDYINRLRIADNCNSASKAVAKANPLKYFLK